MIIIEDSITNDVRKQIKTEVEHLMKAITDKARSLINPKKRAETEKMKQCHEP